MHRRDTREDREKSELEQKLFEPPRCPYPECPSSHGAEFGCVRNGWHETARAPYRVQRFRCRCCHRTFSTQTFAYDYWQKRPELDRLIFMAARACAGNRQIATMLECGKSTVAEKVTRLGRHSIRFFARELSSAMKLKGDLLFDGLGTFEHSQYFPLWLNLAVHRVSGLILGFTDSPLRRSGTMKPAQKRKRARLEALFPKPDPQSIRKGTAELLGALKPFLDLEQLRLVSDECKAYPPAIADACFGKVPHLQIPGSQQRTPENPLFEVNLADMTLRHGSSNQKRETIAFNKRRQAGVERAWLWSTWKNFMSPRRVKRGGPTPAMVAGIAQARMQWSDVFGKRIFSDDVALPDVWQRQVRRELITPRIGTNRKHEAVFAF